MTRNTDSTRRLLTALLAAGLLTGMATVASAQECSTDTDCDEGFHCEIYYGDTCVVAPGQEEPDCGEPVEYGECVRSPIACNTDADCPTYLSCITGYAGEAPPDAGDAAPCMVDENGNCVGGGGGSNNGLIEPAVESYCGYQEIACEVTADCPADFECIVVAQSGGGCAAPACDPDDASCDPGFVDCGDVEVVDYKACAPREIECGADADCPTDWQCVTETVGYCSGGSGDAGAPAPDETGDLIAPDDQCHEETLSRCLPSSLVDYYGGGAAGGEARGNVEDGAKGGSGSDDGGDIFASDGDDDGGSSRSSCSTMNLSPTSGGMPLVALLVLGLALLPLRRR